LQVPTISTTNGANMKIPFAVQIDGQTIEVPGYIVVLAFALRGIRWAVEEADRPEFRERVKLWYELLHAQTFENGDGI
jgi:hypothetical protein